MRIIHPFERVKEKYLKGDIQYKWLILGTFPSEKSRQEGFFYGNQHNVFWVILGEVFGVDLTSMDSKAKEYWLDSQGIALYDIVDSYEGVWHSNDKDLFSLGVDHQYCLEFVKKFLEKHQGARILGTSRQVEKRFHGQFRGRSFKKAERKEIHDFFEGVEMLYIPSPSPRNKNIVGEKRLELWRNAFDLVNKK